MSILLISLFPYARTSRYHKSSNWKRWVLMSFRVKTMSQEHLNQLIVGTKLISLEGGIIPAPPHADLVGDHLMINCQYSNNIGRLSPLEMLSIARADTLVITRTVVKQKLLDGIQSICISFFVELPPANHRCRFYRFSIPSDAIQNDVNAITEACFSTSTRSIQSSQYREIEALLTHERFEVAV
jgi:hypothetical protein